MQTVGTLAITALSIYKLWEDIRVSRLLRQELQSLSNGLLSGLDAPAGRAAGRQPAAIDGGLGPLSGIPNTTGGDDFGSIVGLGEVKQALLEAVVLPTLAPQLFKGIREPPRGVLLYGPPGALRAGGCACLT